MTRAAVQRIATAVDLGRRAAEAVATLAFAGMVGLFGWTVWQRYVVGVPSRWSDELCALVFLWVVFGAAALVVPLREQIAVGILTDVLPPRMARAMQAIGLGVTGLVLLAALPVTLDYINFLWRERTPALMWPLNRAYAIFGLFQGLMGLRLLFHGIAAFVGRAQPG